MPEVRVQDEQGNIHVFPDGSTPEMIAQAMGLKPTAPPAFQPGFAEGVAGAVGAPSTPDELTAAEEAAKPSWKEFGLVASGMKPSAMALGMVKDYASNLYDRGKEAVSEAYDAGRNIGEGGPVGTNLAKAAYPTFKTGLAAIPFVGENANKVGEDVAQGNYAAAGGRALATEALVGLGGKEAGGETPQIPSKARATSNFQQVMAKAKTTPVPVTNELSNALSRYQQLVDRGGSRSLAVSKLLNRITNPNMGALNYAEARDFASNISRLSSDEMGRLTPQMRMQVGEIRVALNDAVGKAADSVGMRPQYEAAMKEYAKAAQLKDIVTGAGKAVVKNIPYFAVGYGAKKLYDVLGGK